LICLHLPITEACRHFLLSFPPICISICSGYKIVFLLVGNLYFIKCSHITSLIKIQVSVVLFGFNLLLLIDLLILCTYLLLQLWHFFGSNLNFKTEFRLLRYIDEINRIKGVEATLNIRSRMTDDICRSLLVCKFNKLNLSSLKSIEGTCSASIGLLILLSLGIQLQMVEMINPQLHPTPENTIF